MPIIENSLYRAPAYLQGGHVSTIVPGLFRRITGIDYQRERLELPDGDFLDLDWSPAPGDGENLAILTHGLLGDSRRSYMLGMAKAFNQAGWHVLSWNMRGLSGEPNRLERMTTHGGSDDLAAVVQHVVRTGRYAHLALVGFSKGGNIALKYAGEQGAALPDTVRHIVAISTPCDVAGSAEAMGARSVYANRFKRKLVELLNQKRDRIAPNHFADFTKFRTLEDFTEHYIAPLHGFRDARDYYEQCSSLPYLANIQVPTLILNAQNDPVLSPSCSPRAIARTSDVLFLETPRHGGHCGFYEKSPDALYWMDRRAVDFVLNDRIIE